jgi:hypothetical protein
MERYQVDSEVVSGVEQRRAVRRVNLSTDRRFPRPAPAGFKSPAMTSFLFWSEPADLPPNCHVAMSQLPQCRRSQAVQRK